MVFRVLSDIPEMRKNRVLDIDLLKGSSQLLCHGQGIAVGAVRCPKAGHGDSQDLISGKAQHVKSSGCHQKSQGGIQSSGDPYDRTGSAGVLHALFKPHGLDGEDLLAAPVPLPMVLRDKWSRINKTVQGQLL
jgi:hypothetical protein